MKTTNSFRSKFFALVLALVASVSSYAKDGYPDFQVDELYYNFLEGDSVQVTFLMPPTIPTEVAADASNKKNVSGAGYSHLTEIVIPSTVIYEDKTYHVTRIGHGAFMYCPNLMHIDLPTSIKSIGEAAFHNCRYLSSITLNEGLESIEQQAFGGCPTLEEVSLPSTLKSLKQKVFYNSKALSKVISKALVPPIVEKDLLTGTDNYNASIIPNATLYVPAESLEAYKTAAAWKEFGQILPIEPTSYKSQWCDKWNMLVRTGSVHPPVEATYRYQLAQDTVIGDYTYTAVVSKAINDALDAPRYVAAVRFTDDRKVYIYYDNAEYLLYDFNVQEGDELEVFAGINNYTSEIKTYKCTVTGVEQYACVGCPATITLEVHNHPDDFREFYRQTQWIERVGDINGFLNGINHYVEMDGGGSEYLLCAYKGDELKYTGDLYEEYGCGDDAEQSPEDLFPTLWGLQRTACSEYTDCEENVTYLMQFDEIKEINGKQYLKSGGIFLREEDNKVLIYSFPYEKDLVLYDWTLEIGDTLQNLGIDPYSFPELEYAAIVDYIAYEDYDEEIGDFIIKKEPLGNKRVKDISTIRLLDGNEYKAWLFGYDWERGDYYIEGIGNANKYGGDYVDLAHPFAVPTCYYGERLVCVSRDGVLLYQIDDAEMERLGTECLCQAEQNPKDLFPTLWGLQRTDVELHTTGDDEAYRSAFNEYVPTLVNGKWYLYDGRNYLREENNQVLLYAPDVEIYEDIVLYDWTLEIGDTLPHNKSTVHAESDFIVKNVSTVTLLDGKKYKKWTLACGYEYIEGIGAINGEGYGHYLCLESWVQPGTYIRTCLVCASRDGQLLYKMDEAEMERLGAECLCDYNSGPKKDNAKNGKIGGRPTPTQWNMLEVETKEMDGTPTILRAETFSYTLENDSIVAKGKTFYQLARQSTKDTAIAKSFVGALHFGEDEDNRVYFLRDGVEYVLYDFTAEPGDTIEIFAGINNYPQETTYTHVVVDKDTLENGACRMMLEVVFPEETSTAENAQKVWLAGLGSIDGIVHNAALRATKARSSETQTSVMLCAWRDDDCLYTTDHPDYDSYGCVYNLPTSIKDIETPGGKCQKIIRDGHLYIIHNGTMYNVIGLEVK